MSKTRGQLISMLQHMKSAPNKNTIKHIKYEDIDAICQYLSMDNITIEDFVQKINILRKTIFFDPRKLRKNQKIFEYCHNSYNTADEHDLKLMNELGEDGYMDMTTKLKQNYHWVSSKGFELLSKIYGVEFVKKEWWLDE